MPRPARLLIGIVLAAGMFSAGYMANRQHGPAATADSAKQAAAYTCPMHPQYISDHPGDCPLCGMRLVPAGAVGSAEAAAVGRGAGAVAVSAVMQQLIGIDTEAVRLSPTRHVLRVPGRIAVDDQRLYRIIAATDGWIVDLGQNTVGRFVKKNQLLATYYTKDLLYNERLFLLSVPANEPVPSPTNFSQASIRTSGAANPMFPIDSLRALGMSDLQIEKLHKTRTPSPHVDVYAPVSGFVLSRSITPGQQFERGTEFYRIADISHVWLWTDIFEKDREFLKPGAEASFVYQGRRFKARLSDALPQFDTESRTLKTRFEVDNPGNLLQPDMFVDVELNVEMPPAITVPADAVFDSGVRRTVFVDRGNGTFEPRRVETGWRLGGRVEVPKGLMEGEAVVTAANFLLDSESRMRAVSAGVFNAQIDPVCGMEVDEKKAAAIGRTAEHDGHTYYFCSDQCKKSFLEDPGKYLEHSHGAPGAAPSMPGGMPGGMPGEGAAARTEGGGRGAEGGTARAAGGGRGAEGGAVKAEGGTAAAKPGTVKAAPMGHEHQAATPEPKPGAMGGGAMQPAATPGAAMPPGQMQMAGAAAGETAKDLICGMDVDKAAAKAAGRTSEYKGATYYFCSDDCKKQFDAQPGKYVK